MLTLLLIYGYLVGVTLVIVMLERSGHTLAMQTDRDRGDRFRDEALELLALLDHAN